MCHRQIKCVRRLPWSRVVLACIVAAASAVAAIGADALDVQVGRTRIIMRGGNYPVLLKLADGPIIMDAGVLEGRQTDGRTRAAVISRDDGHTWEKYPHTLRVSHDGSLCVLPDGTALAFGYHSEPVEGRPDVFSTRRWVSHDHWKTVEDPTPAYVRMPDIIPSLDDGNVAYFGPLFHGRGVAVGDDTILTTMYGKFGSDKPFSKPDEKSKSRSVLVKSIDRGRSWEYVSTIASLHGIADAERRRWQDGFGEPSLAVLPDGKMVCVMRTGTSLKRKKVNRYHDLSQTVLRDGNYVVSTGEMTRPLYQATSTDDGASWSPPRPVPGAVGACPRLLVLDNGVLALSFGRLYRPTQRVAIMFSTDGGETWTDRTELYSGLSSGYTDMVPIGPEKLLLVHDSVTAWGPKYTPDWIGAINIEVKVPQ